MPDRTANEVRYRVGPGRTVRVLAALAAAAAVVTVPSTAAAAHSEALASSKADGGPAAVAEELKKSPVYVDPAAEDQLSKAAADKLAERIVDADKPVFVAVLPDSSAYPRKTLLPDLRTLTGITGVYSVRLGDDFGAAADRQVMSRDAVHNLSGAVKRSYDGSAEQQLNAFVDKALDQAQGSAPESWDGASGSDSGSGGLIVGGVLLAGAAGGGYALYRRAKKKREERERAELEALRVVVDEDITAFGEELDRLDFHPSEAGATDESREDYAAALDAYERAKTQMAGATHPDHVRPVTETLADGRFRLATLAARRAGEPLPERNVPCFFDPRHGPAATDVLWAPDGGTPRDVPACAEDAERVRAGQDPHTRMVQTGEGPQPYWNAGPAYRPWAGGYFGGAGGMVGGLLAGTMLGSLMSAPSAFADTGGEADLPDGGDASGSDFSSADFGSGFSDFGGDSGGDFGDW